MPFGRLDPAACQRGFFLPHWMDSSTATSRHSADAASTNPRFAHSRVQGSLIGVVQNVERMPMATAEICKPSRKTLAGAKNLNQISVSINSALPSRLSHVVQPTPPISKHLQDGPYVLSRSQVTFCPHITPMKSIGRYYIQ